MQFYTRVSRSQISHPPDIEHAAGNATTCNGVQCGGLPKEKDTEAFMPCSEYAAARKSAHRNLSGVTKEGKVHVLLAATLGWQRNIARKACPVGDEGNRAASNEIKYTRW